MCWPFDEVGVVSASFDRAGVAAVAAFRVESFDDFREGRAECIRAVFRGKNPPGR